MKIIVLFMLIPFSCSADFLCGINRVDVLQNGLVVNGTAYRYNTTIMSDNGDYFYKFEGDHQIRMTQHNRMAYKDQKSRWSACKPIIYYREGEK